ncbi:MAG: OmpA family protein [Prosthecobacter sp.]
MTIRRTPPIFFQRSAMAGLLSLLLSLCLTSCGNMPFFKGVADEAVIYALGPREGFLSPVSADLKPACPALLFDDEGYILTARHEGTLRKVFDEIHEQSPKTKLLIAGYAPPALPQDHARALSERRAQAVRQHLIELGLEPANLQTVGFGNDFSPTGPSSDVVVVYRQ